MFPSSRNKADAPPMSSSGIGYRSTSAFPVGAIGPDPKKYIIVFSYQWSAGAWLASSNYNPIRVEQAGKWYQSGNHNIEGGHTPSIRKYIDGYNSLPEGV